MRRLGGALLVLVSASLLWAEARAQQLTQPSATSFFTGVNPHDMTFSKVDTSRALRPPSVNGAFHPPTQQRAFPLGNVFPKISLGSWPPRLPNVSFLQGKNPFQPNPLRGVNPFNPPKK